MRRVLRNNGLSLVFGLLFLAALIGQAFAGHADYNNRQLARGGEPASMLQFVTSSDFAVDVAENWQSEYLQFFLFILATVWWCVDQAVAVRRSPRRQHEETGHDQAERVGVHQLADQEDPVSWLEYLGSADFWNRTLQNWQSEFLAIGSMVVLSIYLRQRGSPESKPVGAPHIATDETG